jgi:hypothetical protein
VPILRTNRFASYGPGVFPTIVDGVGPAAAPTLARWFDHRDCGADVRKRLLAILAELPTDEACQLLIDRLGHPYVPPVMRRAIKRFPQRATRLLLRTAATGSSPTAATARNLLRG